MIEKILAQFARVSSVHTVHLPFFFSRDVQSMRQGSLGKLAELFRVVCRLIGIRLKGPIDLLLYPTGGPHRIPMVRDILLFPWVLLLSRKVVLHFHAAGLADEMTGGGILPRIVCWLYRRAFAAVVMTRFNARDPEAAGIKQILTIPHRIEDTADTSSFVRPKDEMIRLLYLGHLCADKGAPQLLEAFARLRSNRPELHLELAGEVLPPFSEAKLVARVNQLGLTESVSIPGVLTGVFKDEAFRRADLFVFPSIAPYESFGLVLIEAMAWGLPIVATDWRGNRDVLTPDFGGICLSASGSLVDMIADGLEEALERQSEWPRWGQLNRKIFEACYRDTGSNWLAEPVLEIVLPQA